MLLLEILFIILFLLGAVYFLFFSPWAQNIARAGAERKAEIETENPKDTDGIAKRLDKNKKDRTIIATDLESRKAQVAAETVRLVELSSE